MNYFLNVGFHRILVMIIFLSVIAPIAALVEWWKKEGAYVAAKLDARVNSIKRD